MEPGVAQEETKVEEQHEEDAVAHAGFARCRQWARGGVRARAPPPAYFCIIERSVSSRPSPPALPPPPPPRLALRCCSGRREGVAVRDEGWCGSGACAGGSVRGQREGLGLGAAVTWPEMCPAPGCHMGALIAAHGGILPALFERFIQAPKRPPKRIFGSVAATPRPRPMVAPPSAALHTMMAFFLVCAVIHRNRHRPHQLSRDCGRRRPGSHTV